VLGIQPRWWAVLALHRWRPGGGTGGPRCEWAGGRVVLRGMARAGIAARPRRRRLGALGGIVAARYRRGLAGVVPANDRGQALRGGRRRGGMPGAAWREEVLCLYRARMSAAIEAVVLEIGVGRARWGLPWRSLADLCGRGGKLLFAFLAGVLQRDFFQGTRRADFRGVVARFGLRVG